MRVFALRICTLALVMLLAFASGASDAQPANGTDSPTIVVTGHRESRSFGVIVWRFVRNHGKYTRINQIARWREPVCPLVRNLPAEFNSFIVARIVEVARSVRAPTNENCSRANVEIIFTPEPQAIMDEVAAHHSIMLGYHHVPETRAMATVTRPIQAWYVTATSNGVQTIVDAPLNQEPGGTAGSRLTHGLRSVFAHILILVNTNEISGREVGPIADYLALLALSQTDDLRPATNCAELPSIADLLADNCPEAQRPQALTSADRAYLEGLYTMTPTDVGSLQRGHLYERVVRGVRPR